MVYLNETMCGIVSNGYVVEIVRVVARIRVKLKKLDFGGRESPCSSPRRIN